MSYDFTCLSNARTFAFSPENPDGKVSGGSQGTYLEKCRPLIFIEPGETINIMDTDGPGIIESMWFGGFTPWDFVIRIYWDHQEYPSVESPMSAFLGYPFYNHVTDVNGNFPTLNSAMFLVTPCRGMNSYWKMPFKKHCRITVENRHPSQRTKIHYTIIGEYRELPENSLYFCASYRQARPVPQDREYTVIDGIKGAGHFAGLTLGIGLAGASGCWSEGEPKMYIDGEKYPSINYTGLEDYFGGSFNFGDCDPAMGHYQTYSGLYMGMYALFGGAGGKESRSTNMMPRVMLYRWHQPDPIRFTKEFKMTLQSINFSPYGNQVRHDDYVTVAYWYQTLPTSPLAPLPSPGEVDLT